MTADEAVGRAEKLLSGAVSMDGRKPVCIYPADLRALLAEIERLRASESRKRRVRAFAAVRPEGDLAVTTVKGTEREVRERMGASVTHYDWRVVPVTITWEDGDADE